MYLTKTTSIDTLSTFKVQILYSQRLKKQGLGMVNMLFLNEHINHVLDYV